jgi:hypothetical protein
MQSGRLSFCKGEGWVRVDSGAWGSKREPLTSVLSPWLKGRGGKNRDVAIPTYESTNTAARSDCNASVAKIGSSSKVAASLWQRAAKR